MSDGPEPEPSPRRGAGQSGVGGPVLEQPEGGPGGADAGRAGQRDAAGGAAAAERGDGEPDAAASARFEAQAAGAKGGEPDAGSPAAGGTSASGISESGTSESGTSASGTSASGTSGETVPARPVKRRGGFLALLALLIACVALAAIGWPYWMMYRGEDPLARIGSECLAALEARLAELENTRSDARSAERAAEAAAEAAARDASAAARRASDATATVAALREAFMDLSASTADATPLDDRQWRLAEAAYLLRVANMRARMEDDRDGARALLEAADALLADLDDYGLFPVREEIAAALSALRSQPVADRVGLYLELEQLGDRLARLPLDLPEYRPNAAAPEEDARWYEALGARAAGLFEFRADRRQPIRPLLAPDEAVYLRHNLLLQLEQAQLALLRGDAVVWVATLAEARGWVQAHFDGDDPEAVALAGALTRLLGERIAVPAPDISRPLAALQRLRGRGIPESAP